MKSILSLAFLMLATVASIAAPPEVPQELKAPPGKVKEFVVKHEKGKSPEYKLVGGAAAFRGFPGDVDTETVFWLVPEEGKPLYIVWWTTGVKGSTTTYVNKDLVVVPPIPDPKDPPVTPPTGKYFFYIVRDDGPSSPAFTKTMSLPQWQTLRTAGHKVKDYTLTEASKFGLTAQVPTPYVVTLIEEGGKSFIVRQPIPLPVSGDGILKLPENVR